ncbi:MAG TPA: STAS domain-containing protein [Pyrinomonadaceae bacterium]|jgi:anti-sigma B factor antagonist|nr:STAS domain-containing protein [Pyrinomonadaceae bacterium]
MAELDVKERQAGDVTILDLRGEVRIGEGSIALRDAIRNLTDTGKKKLLLNLAGVSYIDSSGIGELIANYTTVSRQGGQLKLLKLTDRVQNLLVITKLLTVFDAYDDEAEALKSFS